MLRTLLYYIRVVVVVVIVVVVELAKNSRVIEDREL
jgi:hypothetical protein